jgi:hypothetical protein
MADITTMAEAEDRYDDYLDEMYPLVEIGSMTKNPSIVVKTMSPLDYRCGLFDYLDAMGINTDDLED